MVGADTYLVGTATTTATINQNARRLHTSRYFAA